MDIVLSGQETQELSLFFGSKHLAMCCKSLESHILQAFTQGQNSISLKFRTSWPGTKPFLLYWISLLLFGTKLLK